MRKIMLNLHTNRYRFQGRTYNKGEVYALADDKAEYLLAQRNKRDIPYFTDVDVVAFSEAGPAELVEGDLRRNPDTGVAEEWDGENWLSLQRKAKKKTAKKTAKKAASKSTAARKVRQTAPADAGVAVG